jgi:hypothetical protein
LQEQIDKKAKQRPVVKWRDMDQELLQQRDHLAAVDDFEDEAPVTTEDDSEFDLNGDITTSNNLFEFEEDINLRSETLLDILSVKPRCHTPQPTQVTPL